MVRLVIFVSFILSNLSFLRSYQKNCSNELPRFFSNKMKGIRIFQSTVLPTLLHRLWQKARVTFDIRGLLPCTIHWTTDMWYSRTSIKRPPSIKRPLSKVPNYYFVSKMLYSIPLFNGQPLLSGQFSKSPGWPFNRGPTVSLPWVGGGGGEGDQSSHLQFSDVIFQARIVSGRIPTCSFFWRLVSKTLSCDDILSTEKTRCESIRPKIVSFCSLYIGIRRFSQGFLTPVKSPGYFSLNSWRLPRQNNYF